MPGAGRPTAVSVGTAECAAMAAKKKGSPCGLPSPGAPQSGLILTLTPFPPTGDQRHCLPGGSMSHVYACQAFV